MASGDQRMLTGKSLGPLRLILMANRDGLQAYRKMAASKDFQNPVSYQSLQTIDADALILPGGHAPGMKPYLESTILQRIAADFISVGKPVGAICHGVVLAARSKLPNGRSVLFKRKTTSLLNSQELLAWGLTCLWLGSYYRTYPQTVEDEVRCSLESDTDFIRGPAPLRRDSPSDLTAGFIVRDGNYLSARWPGDAHRFANEFLKMLHEHHAIKGTGLAAMNEDARRFWNAFIETLSENEKPHSPSVSAAYAGTVDITDELIALYLAGKKTAGSSLVDDFRSSGDPLPKLGDFWIMLDRFGHPKCIAKTVQVEINKFKDVPDRIAAAEGEGDLSLNYWRNSHKKFFAPHLSSWGISNLDDAEVVTEHFEVVFPVTVLKK